MIPPSSPSCTGYAPPMMTFIIYVPASAKTCYNKGGSMLSTNISFMNSA